MKLYADTPARLIRQVAGDLLLVAWVAAWVWVGLTVHDVVLRLAVPGEQLDEAGTSLAGWLTEASTGVDDLPIVDDAVAAPFLGASSAAGQVAAAGRAQVEAVETMALWLAVAVVLVPVLLALVVHLPLRLRFVRQATAMARALRQSTDPSLFALRALAHQPLRAIQKVSPEPVAAWRAGDQDVIERLAALELEGSGLRPGRTRRS
ncbi:hypothetical protein [Puerhibacterium sp. TATVAM-FAB25]|uniref:hypothetical protein n=1 Tax=Puerhibacterium sp. TATVAM-FAB25 TaxID=3093699 RepID=UPI003978A4B2